MKQRFLPAEEEYIKEDIFLRAFEDSDPPWNFVFRDVVDSTNTLAKEMAEAGEPEVTVVWAEEQTQGRGRMGRTWFSEPHQNILMSLLLRPKIPKERVYVVTAALSVSAVMAIESIVGLKPKVKWPNDVLLGGKKVAGILTEFSLKGGAVDYLVTGIGINVNWSPPEGELIYPATSLYLESGKRMQREHLAVKLLKNFEILYFHIREKRYDEILNKWVKKADFFGKEVSIHMDGRRVEGIPIGLNPNGSLVLQGADGQRVVIEYGDLMGSQKA